MHELFLAVVLGNDRRGVADDWVGQNARHGASFLRGASEGIAMARSTGRAAQQGVCRAGKIGFSMRLGLVLLIGIVLGATVARAQSPDPLVACPSILSADQRLLMEQWALRGGCERPVRTRVVDRFLGYTCTATGPASRNCRHFIPASGSWEFNTLKHFRCIDVALSASEEGVSISHMREWVAPRPRQCDWDPNLNILATEIDFGHGQICIASLCIASERLSRIGQIRLRMLIERSLRELGLAPAVEEPETIGLSEFRFRRSH
jgi:hypothetical protein